MVKCEVQSRDPSSWREGAGDGQRVTARNPGMPAGENQTSASGQAHEGAGTWMVAAWETRWGTGQEPHRAFSGVMEVSAISAGAWPAWILHIRPSNWTQKSTHFTVCK